MHLLLSQPPDVLWVHPYSAWDISAARNTHFYLLQFWDNCLPPHLKDAAMTSKCQNFHEAKIQSCSGMLRNKGAMETRIMALWLNYSLTELLVQFIILYGIRVDDLEFKPHLRFTSHLKSVGSCLLRESL